MFVYHVYESLSDPRLYKVDHCCLSLSRELWPFAVVFRSVASCLKDKYYILRADMDMYLHCFVRSLASGRY